MVTSGLSSNEIYCLQLKGLTPNDLIIGNSVYALGVLGGLRSGMKAFFGGELESYTQLFAEGRSLATDRMLSEREKINAKGVTGVVSSLIFHPENIEFLSIGSGVDSVNNIQFFSSSASGQELYSQIDSNYIPVKFVFGNVAYSIGVMKSFTGGLKSFVKGEVKEFTDIFVKTRNLALDRIISQARNVNANSVLGIKTEILTMNYNIEVEEMLMSGTASYNNNLSADYTQNPITCNLSAEEIWNISKMGYIPQKLMIGTSVYSLGAVGNFAAALRSFVKGEVSQLTQLIYSARESAIQKIKDEASSIGADEVINIKTYVNSIGGTLIEFLAIGTAIKRDSKASTFSENLISQAITQNRETFFSYVPENFGVSTNTSRTQGI
jgi:uncharacterized protein YbjQ (UPF0145 family)